MVVIYAFTRRATRLVADGSDYYSITFVEGVTTPRGVGDESGLVDSG